jgi:hypothetical protein
MVLLVLKDRGILLWSFNLMALRKNLMLRNKAYEAYETWWEYWLSKIPQNPLSFERSTRKPLKPKVESNSDRARVLQRLRLNPFHNISNGVPDTAAEGWED